LRASGATKKETVMRRVLAVAMILPLLMVITVPPSVSAQTSTGTLRGALVDETGACIPGAAISATHRATAERFETKSGPDGSFALTQLPGGSYSVRVELSGFKPWERKRLTVRAGRTSTVKIKMKVAGMECWG
jgi:hypothetical protein